MRRQGMRSAFMAFLVLLAGCDGDGEAASTTTDPTTTTDTTTTTTVPTTTTTSVTGPAPWTDVVVDIARREWALDTDPNPDLVSRVYAEDCECYEFIHGNIAELASRGERFTGEAPRPIAVLPQGETTMNGSRYLLVKYELGTQQLVGPDGAIIEEIPASEPMCVGMFVTPDGANGAYRIHDYLVPDHCPEGL